MKKMIIFFMALIYVLSGLSQNSPSKPSEFGHSFTPFDDLRVLVLFVSFDNFDTIDDANWPAGQPMPNWANEDEFLFQDFSAFDTLTSYSQIQNFSNYYYQMSNHRFRMIEECL